MSVITSHIGIVQYSKWDGADIDTKGISVEVIDSIIPPRKLDVLIIALDQRHLLSPKSDVELVNTAQIDVALSLKMGIVLGCNIANADFSEAVVPKKEYPNAFPEDHFGNHRAAANRLLSATDEQILGIKTDVMEKVNSGKLILNVSPQTTDARVMVVSCTDTREGISLLKSAFQHWTAGMIVFIGHGNTNRVGSYFARDVCDITVQLCAKCVVLGSCCGGVVAQACSDILPLIPFLGCPTKINMVVPYAGLVTYMCSNYVLLSTRTVKSIDKFRLGYPGDWMEPNWMYLVVMYMLAKKYHEKTFPVTVTRLKFYALRTKEM